MIKKCLACGKLFKKNPHLSYKQWATTRFCSNKCGQTSLKHKGHIPWNKGEKIKKKCLTCGKKFFIRPYELKQKRKFCSHKCYGIYRKEFIDERHYNWKGDDVGYVGLHIWVKKHLGEPTKCEHCGAVKKDKRFHWANIDHKYRRNLDDYIALCVPCHKKYDLENGLCNH